MSEPPVQEIMKVAQWAVRSWKGDPEYPDILGESYLEAWRGYQAGLEQGARSPLTWATRRALRAPVVWLRRWYGRKGHAPLRQAAVTVPLEKVEHLVMGAGWVDQTLNRLEHRELTGRVWANCTPRQRQVLYRLFWLQERR